ncbi:MAG: hypothetical protein ABI824_07015 [Acidobacteriota bacterium]
MDPREYSYVAYAYITAWVIVIAYVVSLSFRDRKLRQELDRVRRMVEKS